MDFFKDAGALLREAVPECGNFRIKTEMAVGIYANVFSSLKSKYECGFLVKSFY